MSTLPACRPVAAAEQRRSRKDEMGENQCAGHGARDEIDGTRSQGLVVGWEGDLLKRFGGPDGVADRFS